jgi:digeranylgeranylglycerophospholipid reductase
LINRPVVSGPSRRECWDAVIVGAGPAGLMAARTLAAQGHAVAVLEEHPAIGYPVHCTGLVGIDAFDELTLPRGAIRTIVQSARFNGPDGSTVTIESDRIRAAVIDRGEFDAALAAEVSAAGAVVRLGARVSRIEVAADAVTVAVDHAENRDVLRARACVLACGASYRFNRRLGLSVPGHLVRTAQAEVPFSGDPQVDVYIGRDVAPQGFGWVVPFRRNAAAWARIGLMCAERAQPRFEAFVARVWRERGLDAPMPRPYLKALPLAPSARTYADRVLAVGDAAGIVKPTTGGGIYYGLLSGEVAGDVLMDGLHRDRLHADALRAYETRWIDRIGPDIRAGIAFRKLTSRLSDRAVNGLIELARVDGIVPLLKDVGNFNWHRRAVVELLRHAGFRRAILGALGA